MKIGIVKEIKDRENRVSVTPQGVSDLVSEGHSVLLEKGAGLGSGFSDQEYEKTGAIISSTDDVWSVDLVVKVKEPLESEYQYLDQQMI
jgi:alanine dehydrogenase